MIEGDSESEKYRSDFAVNTAKANLLVLKSEKITSNPDLFEALMDFQYGSQDQSQQGFARLVEASSEPGETSNEHPE